MNTPSPRSQAVVPHSVLIPGVGWVRYPKHLVGKIVSEAISRALWEEHIKPHIPVAPKLKRTSNA